VTKALSILLQIRIGKEFRTPNYDLEIYTMLLKFIHSGF